MTVRELGGWVPATVTYGPDGSVLSVTVPESRFSPGDVDVLLTARRMREEPRGHHGRSMREATDPANQFRYRVPDPSTDFASKALAEAVAKSKRKYGDEFAQHLVHRVELRD